MKYKYNIKNLYCANCAKKIEETLNKDKNIKSTSVNFAKQTVIVETNISDPFNYVKDIVEKIEPDAILSKEEIKYILLCLLYKVIDYLKEGYKIKFGTIFKISLEQRDIRVNLPNVRNRIIEDRLIPKIELCRSFGYNLFQEINKDNAPIINYYRSKIERYLMLLKVKQSNKNENN